MADRTGRPGRGLPAAGRRRGTDPDAQCLIIPPAVAAFFAPMRPERTWEAHVIVTGEKRDESSFQVELRVGELPVAPDHWQMVALTEACRQIVDGMDAYVVGVNSNVLCNLSDEELRTW